IAAATTSGSATSATVTLSPIDRGNIWKYRIGLVSRIEEAVERTIRIEEIQFVSPVKVIKYYR
ncbi:hypothetical protein, partial [Aeromonas veronii]|uniref:hypothetical protein n=1 Tax=Aeromonas veronii TaxID=654 RepID=UPI001A8D278E